MAIDDSRTARDDFNMGGTTEAFRTKRGYDLKELESRKIDGYLEERDQKLDQEKREFSKPGEFEKRRDAEYERLSNENSPSPQRHLTPDGAQAQPNRAELIRRAGDNVLAQHDQRLEGLSKDCDRKIGSVLQQARDEGRGPERDQQQDRSQDQDRGSFAREQDRDRG